jgi:hypothetical protein
MDVAMRGIGRLRWVATSGALTLLFCVCTVAMPTSRAPAEAAPTATFGGGSFNAALMVSGKPHDFYQSGSALRHAWYDGAGWQFETIDSPFVDGHDITAYPKDRRIAAVLSGTTIMVFYYDQRGHALELASNDGTGWRLQILDGAGSAFRSTGATSADDVGNAPSATLAYGQPQVFYWDSSLNLMRHAWLQTATWHFADLTGPGKRTNIGFLGGGESATVMCFGTLHVLFDSGGELVHAWYAQAGWKFEYVDGNHALRAKSPGADGDFLAMNLSAVATKGRLDVFYYALPGLLRHASLSRKGWTRGYVDGEGALLSSDAVTDNVGTSSAAAYIAGRLNVWYYDATVKGLRHAWWIDGIARYEFTDGNYQTNLGGVSCCTGDYVSVLTNDLGGPELFYEYVFDEGGRQGELLRHATQTGAGWQSESLDCGYLGCPSRVYGVNAPPPEHTSHSVVPIGGVAVDFYPDPLDKTLRGGGLAAGAWKTVIVDGAGSPYSGSSTDLIGFDVAATVLDGSPHVFYWDETRGTLKHAWLDSDYHWQYETIGPMSHVGGGIGAANVDGVIHVFYEENAGTLRDAWSDNGTWLYEDIDGGNGTTPGGATEAGYSGLSATVVGTVPHLFYSADLRDLKHAWHDNSGWHFELVDGPDAPNADHTTDDAATPSSVVYDGTALQVFYSTLRSQSTQRSLRTAHQDTNGWSLQTLDGIGSASSPDRTTDSVGAVNSTVLLDGNANVFYSDDFNSAIRHAWYADDAWHFGFLDGDVYTSSGAQRRPANAQVAAFANPTQALPTVLYTDSPYIPNPGQEDVIRLASGTANAWSIRTVGGYQAP